MTTPNPRPADRLRAIANRVFSPRTIERVVDPVLADMQREYDEARERNGMWHARWSLARSYIALGRALFWLGVDTAWHADDAPEFARTCLLALGLARSVRRAASAVMLAIALPGIYYAVFWTFADVMPGTPNVLLAVAGSALLVRGLHHQRA